MKLTVKQISCHYSSNEVYSIIVRNCRSFNALSGNLPQSFNTLSTITTLYLQNNQFSGPIDVLANLPLQDLNVANNRFTGWIPEQLKKINNLQTDGNAAALSGQICQICGDDVGLTADGELFVACNECAFPTCRICYEYERWEGNQVCPQCKTRFKRLKGCARVSGDKEEDGVDDLENEFAFMGKDKQDNQLESMLQGHMSYGRRAYGRN